ncbi:MAG: globin [Deltaproteobacteria bacterium]|nr:globin [Deltaproteobacteria bacterium]
MSACYALAPPRWRLAERPFATARRRRGRTPCNLATGIDIDSEDCHHMRVLGLDLVDLFHTSFGRITGDPELNKAFFDSFYGRFIESDPVVAEKFEDTNMVRQKQMLRESLLVMASFFAHPEVTDEIDRLATVHGPRGQQIARPLYDRWLECLVDTVQEVDPQWNRDIELAWRVVMAPGIALMKWM